MPGSPSPSREHDQLELGSHSRELLRTSFQSFLSFPRARIRQDNGMEGSCYGRERGRGGGGEVRAQGCAGGRPSRWRPRLTTPRLILFGFGSARNFSVTPRIGSRGASSTSAQKSTTEENVLLAEAAGLRQVPLRRFLDADSILSLYLSIASCLLCRFRPPPCAFSMRNAMTPCCPISHGEDHLGNAGEMKRKKQNCSLLRA